MQTSSYKSKEKEKEKDREKEQQTTEKSWRELGLETLIGLVKKKKIDPWDVNLIFLADKFLEEVKLKEKSSQLEAAGKVILFISQIFRLKTEKLNNNSIDSKKQNEVSEKRAHDFLQEVFFETGAEELDLEELDLRLENTIQKIDPELREELVESLSLELEKRALDNLKEPQKLIKTKQYFPKTKRVRKVTMFDLVNFFQESLEEENSLETEEREETEINISKESLNQTEKIRIDESQSIFEIAHEENLEQKIKDFSQLILSSLKLNEFKELKELKVKGIEGLAELFLTTIFLSHDGKVTLFQDLFYQDLKVKRIV